MEQVVRPTGLIDPQSKCDPPAPRWMICWRRFDSTVERGERVLVTTLTKRMSEDLTEYLADQRYRVRYLHSDIETVERVEIIRRPAPG